MSRGIKLGASGLTGGGEVMTPMVDLSVIQIIYK